MHVRLLDVILVKKIVLGSKGDGNMCDGSCEGTVASCVVKKIDDYLFWYQAIFKLFELIP